MVSSSTKFPITHSQGESVCTISPTGMARIILVLDQVRFPPSVNGVGRTSPTRKATLQEPRYEIRPGHSKSIWKKRPENRSASFLDCEPTMECCVPKSLSKSQNSMTWKRPVISRRSATTFDLPEQAVWLPMRSGPCSCDQV